MKLWPSSVILFLTICVFAAHARKLPSYVKVCKKNDPVYDDCLANLVNNLRPRLIKGIPKMYIPPIDPIVISAVEVTRDLEALKVRARFTNIVAHGPGDYVINYLKSDLDKLVMEGSVTLPHLEVTMDYEVDGRILVVPFKGKGVFRANFTDVTLEGKGKGKIVKKNGKDYIQISDVKGKIRVDYSNLKMKVKDENQEALEPAIAFFYQNKKQIVDIVIPIIEETGEEIGIQIGNNILGSAPMSELLPV